MNGLKTHTTKKTKQVNHEMRFNLGSYSASNVLAPVAEQHVEDVVLRSRSQGRLVHGAGQQFRVPDDDVRVVDAELLVAGVRLSLRHQVGLHPRLLVGAKHEAEDLNRKHKHAKSSS